jgi:hypothetical protein
MTVPGQADAGPAGPSPEDLPHLRRCVELAAEAVDAGDHPFGSDEQVHDLHRRFRG